MNQPVDSLDGLIRLRIDLAYDGTDFAGWAKQPKLRTVQGDLIKALEVIFGTDPDDFGMRVAGRTDAGVHARHQVAHIDLSPAQIKRLGRHASHEAREAKLMGRINSILDPDVRVHGVSLAPAGFDARFSASHRRYRYRISDGLSVKDPVDFRYVLWTRKPLNLQDMQLAASKLKGLHDFASFCKPRPFSTTIRELREVTVTRNEQINHLVEIELEADAFCHNMVRAIVGALIAVGEGRATPTEIAAILAKKNRVGSFKVVSPHGLTLIEIGYVPEADMAAQAERTKDLRTLEDDSQK
jgi:tRNA pseudouridine38-40 synthase